MINRTWLRNSVQELGPEMNLETGPSPYFSIEKNFMTQITPVYADGTMGHYELLLLLPLFKLPNY